MSPRVLRGVAFVAIVFALVDAGRADALFFRRAFNSVRRAFAPAVRAVQRTVTRGVRVVTSTARRAATVVRRTAGQAARTVQRAATVATRAVVQTARRVGTAVVQTANKVGTAVVAGARAVGNAVAEGVSGMLDKLKSLGFGFDKIKEMFCATIGKPVCVVVDLVKEAKTFVERIAKHGIKDAIGMTVDDLKKAISAKADRMREKAEQIFANFRSVLTAKEFNLGTITNFAKSNFDGIRNLAREVFSPLLPFPFNELTPVILGVVGTAALTPTLGGIGALSFGFKKLMGFLIPKLILGAGNAFNFVAEHLPPGFRAFADKLISFVTGGGGQGILAGVFLMSSPETKKKLQNIAARVATVAGSVSGALGGVMKMARGDSFADAAKAISAESAAAEKPAGKAPPPLTKDQMEKIVDGLGEMAQDGLIKLADEPVRKLLGKALQGLNRLLDVPRNALVAAVGTIPLIGGVVSSALNFGLGIVVDMVNELITDGVMTMTKDIIKDVVADVNTAVKKELFKTPGNMKSAQGAVKLVELVAKAAQEVAKLATAASKGEAGLVAGALVGALNNFLLRGVSNPDVRAVLAKALEGVADSITKRGSLKGYGLGDAAKDALLASSKPLAALVSKPISNPRLRSVAAKAIESVLENAAKSGLGKIMGNPRGFLTAIAIDATKKMKPDLVELLTSGLKSQSLKNVVAKAVDELESMITDQGFNALLPFGKLLNTLGLALTRGSFDEFTSLLATNVQKAKETLQGFADKVVGVFGAAKSVTQPVMASINEGSSTLVTQAVACRGQIDAMSTGMLSNLFGCLQGALSKAGMAAAKKLYGEFVAHLKTDCHAALGKLNALAGVITRVFPKLQPLAGKVIGSLQSKCSAVAQ